MKTKQFLGVIILTILSFLSFSCENEGEATIEFPVPGLVSFDLDDIQIGEIGDISPRSATEDGLIAFSSSVTLDADFIKKLPNDFQVNISRIKSISASSASIKITSEGEEDKIVKEFLVKTNGISPNLSIPEYELDTPYTGGSAVKDYVIKLLLSVIFGNTPTMEISGKTNVTSGKNIKISVTLEGVMLEIAASSSDNDK